MPFWEAGRQRPVSPCGPARESHGDFMSRERDWTQARPAINWLHPWGRERIRPGGLQGVASIGYFSVPSRREWETTRSNLAWWRLGYEVDSTIADQLALVADSKIVLAAGSQVLASTFAPKEESELQPQIFARLVDPGSSSSDLILGRENYRVASVVLHDGPPSPVHCYVLVPLKRSIGFINQLNRTIPRQWGLSRIFSLSCCCVFVSGTITRPLDNLVAASALAAAIMCTNHAARQQ